MDNTFGSF
jgi:hypothetical protein